MSTTPNIRSFHVVIDASPDAVFDYLNDLSNMPQWSIHFCKGIRLIDGGAIVTSPMGEMYFGITSDRETGVLDWWSGPSMESATRWPTRVVSLPDGQSLFQVTAILRTGAHIPNLDRLFADELGMLKILLEEQTVAA